MKWNSNHFELCREVSYGARHQVRMTNVAMEQLSEILGEYRQTGTPVTELMCVGT